MLPRSLRAGPPGPRAIPSGAKAEDLSHLLRAQAEKELEGPLSEGPFRGVPFLVKDLVLGYAGVPTTSGSRLFAGAVAPADSELMAASHSERPPSGASEANEWARTQLTCTPRQLAFAEQSLQRSALV